MQEPGLKVGDIDDIFTHINRIFYIRGDIERKRGVDGTRRNGNLNLVVLMSDSELMPLKVSCTGVPVRPRLLERSSEIHEWVQPPSHSARTDSVLPLLLMFTEAICSKPVTVVNSVTPVDVTGASVAAGAAEVRSDFGLGFWVASFGPTE